MEQLLASLATFVAAVGSLVAAVVAVDQLTLSARDRRKATAIREALKVETELNPNSAQSVALASLHRSVVARIAAREGVGGGRIPGSLLFLAAGASLGVLAGRATENIGRLGPQFDQPDIVVAWMIAAGLWFFALYLSLHGARHLLVLLRRRNEIEHRYVSGDAPVISSMTPGSKSSHPGVDRVALGFSIGTTLMFAGLGAWNAVPKDEVSFLGSLASLGGCLVCIIYVFAAIRFTTGGLRSGRHLPITSTAPPADQGDYGEPPASTSAPEPDETSQALD